MTLNIRGRCRRRNYKEEFIMAYVITEGDGKYVIDADVCAECGTCVDECPVEAIVEA